MGPNVVFKYQLVQGANGFLDGQTLRQYVHAVVFLINHFLQASHLAFKYFCSMQCPLLNINNHTFSLIPLGGISQVDRTAIKRSPEGLECLKVYCFKNIWVVLGKIVVCHGDLP